jgi:RND family efflux transporter MFP subunit
MRRKRNQNLTRRRKVRQIAGFAACLVILAGCQPSLLFTPDSKTDGVEQAVKKVTTAKAVLLKMEQSPELTGEVASSAQSDIIPSTGGTVLELAKKRGDSVQAGDLLVKLGSSDAVMQRDRAKLAVVSAQEAIDKARKDQVSGKAELSTSLQKKELEQEAASRAYNKLRNEYITGAATALQVEQAETELKRNQIDLELLRQKMRSAGSADSFSNLELQLKSAQLSLTQAEEAVSGLEVRAPISGVLTELSLEEGVMLQPGTKVGSILKIDPIKIKAQLYEDKIKLLKGKSELTFYAAGTADRLRGSISYVADFIDPATKAYELNLGVSNKDKLLKPGMKVRIVLAEEVEELALAVPAYSIVKEGDSSYVYVLAGGNQAEKRKVVPGRLNEPDQEIVSGLKEGETVILTGTAQLQDKERVQPAAMAKSN